MSNNLKIVENEDNDGIIRISITCDKEMLISIRENNEETEDKVVLQIPRLASMENKVIGSIGIIEENKKDNTHGQSHKKQSHLIHDGSQIPVKQARKMHKRNLIHNGEQNPLIRDEDQNNI